MIRTEEYKFLPDFVKPASELKAKRTCCRSACMNCPYGFTTKKHNLLFKKPFYSEIDEVKRNLGIDIQVNYKDYELMVLKGFLIGVIKVDKIFVTEIHLHPLMSEENFPKELIESYYFC